MSNVEGVKPTIGERWNNLSKGQKVAVIGTSVAGAGLVGTTIAAAVKGGKLAKESGDVFINKKGEEVKANLFSKIKEGYKSFGNSIRNIFKKADKAEAGTAKDAQTGASVEVEELAPEQK